MDGEKGVVVEIIYLSLHCQHQNDYCYQDGQR